MSYRSNNSRGIPVWTALVAIWSMVVVCPAIGAQEPILKPVPESQSNLSQAEAICPQAVAPVACQPPCPTGCDDECCRANARFWGYYVKTWRRWPCEDRVEERFYQSINRELIATPPGEEPEPMPEVKIGVPRSGPQIQVDQGGGTGPAAMPYSPEQMGMPVLPTMPAESEMHSIPGMPSIEAQPNPSGASEPPAQQAVPKPEQGSALPEEANGTVAADFDHSGLTERIFQKASLESKEEKAVSFAPLPPDALSKGPRFSKQDKRASETFEVKTAPTETVARSEATKIGTAPLPPEFHIPSAPVPETVLDAKQAESMKMVAAEPAPILEAAPATKILEQVADDTAEELTSAAVVEIESTSLAGEGQWKSKRHQGGLATVADSAASISKGEQKVSFEQPAFETTGSIQEEVQTDLATVEPVPKGPLGLDGYCPVELVLQESWVEGSEKLAAAFEGRTYYFSGKKQLQAFQANPSRFAPAVAGMDLVLAAEKGKAASGHTETCVIYQERLYMFSSQATLERFNRQPGVYLRWLKQNQR